MPQTGLLISKYGIIIFLQVINFTSLVETEAGWRRTFVLDGSLARTSFGDVYFRSVVFGIAADSGAFVFLCHLA